MILLLLNVHHPYNRTSTLAVCTLLNWFECEHHISTVYLAIFATKDKIASRMKTFQCCDILPLSIINRCAVLWCLGGYIIISITVTICIDCGCKKTEKVNARMCHFCCSVIVSLTFPKRRRCRKLNCWGWQTEKGTSWGWSCSPTLTLSSVVLWWGEEKGELNKQFFHKCMQTLHTLSKVTNLPYKFELQLQLYECTVITKSALTPFQLE